VDNIAGNEDIDTLITQIENSQKEVEGVVKATRELETINADESKATMPVIAEEIFNKVNTNDKIAEEIYKLFYGDLSTGRDISTSSKEALLRSLELRVESSKVLAELAKAVAKRDGEKSKSFNGVGVSINTNPGNMFGINIEKIKEEMED